MKPCCRSSRAVEQKFGQECRPHRIALPCEAKRHNPSAALERTCARPAEHLRPGRSRIGCRWREILRITKRTQSCAKRGPAPISRRIFMDWLYPRPAKLEQEQASAGDSESSRSGDHSAGGGTSPCSRMLALRQFTSDCHSEGSEESVVRWCKAESSARTAGLGMASIRLLRHTRGRFRAEPRPTPSQLFATRRRWISRPAEYLRPGRSRIGSG